MASTIRNCWTLHRRFIACSQRRFICHGHAAPGGSGGRWRRFGRCREGGLATSGLWNTAKSAFACQVMQQTLLPIFPALLGSNEHRLSSSRAWRVTAMNALLRTYADRGGVDLGRYRRQRREVRWSMLGTTRGSGSSETRGSSGGCSDVWGIGCSLNCRANGSILQMFGLGSR